MPVPFKGKDMVMMIKKKRLTLFDLFNYAVMFLILIFCIYPFLYELAVSLSDGKAVAAGKVSLLPIGFNLHSYVYVLTAKRLGVLTGLFNSILYSGIGTLVAVFITFMTAYVLTRKKFRARRTIMTLFMITYVFEAGLIPTYIILNGLGFVNQPLVMIVPAAISTYLLIIMRTFLSQVPVSLEEAALMDGANDWQIMFGIYFPISKPAVATISLFYLVQKWNDFLTPLIYLKEESLRPLQLVLYNFTVTTNALGSPLENVYVGGVMLSYRTLTAAIVIITILPILCAYPFAQKYFTSGLMMGSVKE